MAEIVSWKALYFLRVESVVFRKWLPHYDPGATLSGLCYCPNEVNSSDFKEK